MTTMQDLRKKTDVELAQTVEAARQTMQKERFKDRLSRKASVIKTAKLAIARALSELTLRRNQNKK